MPTFPAPTKKDPKRTQTYPGMKDQLAAYLDGDLLGDFDAVLIATNTALLDANLKKEHAVGTADYTALVGYLRQHEATKHAKISVLTPWYMWEKNSTAGIRSASRVRRNAANNSREALIAWGEQQQVAVIDGYAFGREMADKKQHLLLGTGFLPNDAATDHIGNWLAAQLAVPGSEGEQLVAQLPQAQQHIVPKGSDPKQPPKGSRQLGPA